MVGRGLGGLSFVLCCRCVVRCPSLLLVVGGRLLFGLCPLLFVGGRCLSFFVVGRCLLFFFVACPLDCRLLCLCRFLSVWVARGGCCRWLSVVWLSEVVVAFFWGRSVGLVVMGAGVGAFGCVSVAFGGLAFRGLWAVALGVVAIVGG